MAEFVIGSRENSTQKVVSPIYHNHFISISPARQVFFFKKGCIDLTDY